MAKVVIVEIECDDMCSVWKGQLAERVKHMVAGVIGPEEPEEDVKFFWRNYKCSF